MTAAANRQQKIVLSSKLNCGDDVGNFAATGNQPRTSIDHPIVQLAGRLILLISGQDQFTAQICLEGTERGFIELHTIHNDLHNMYIVIFCQVPAFLTKISSSGFSPSPVRPRAFSRVVADRSCRSAFPAKSGIFAAPARSQFFFQEALSVDWLEVYLIGRFPAAYLGDESGSMQSSMKIRTIL